MNKKNDHQSLSKLSNLGKITRVNLSLKFWRKVKLSLDTFLRADFMHSVQNDAQSTFCDRFFLKYKQSSETINVIGCS
jgi:hypothetical protein